MSKLAIIKSYIIYVIPFLNDIYRVCDTVATCSYDLFIKFPAAWPHFHFVNRSIIFRL